MITDIDRLVVDRVEVDRVSSCANTAVTPLRPVSFPCGMAMPFPSPVDPN